MTNFSMFTQSEKVDRVDARVTTFNTAKITRPSLISNSMKLAAFTSKEDVHTLTHGYILYAQAFLLNYRVGQ